jgi:YfiH family protein
VSGVAIIRPAVLSALGPRAGFTTRLASAGEGIPSGSLAFGLVQVHSDRVVLVRPEDDPARVGRVEADGLVTTAPAVVLTIRVADCVPVLLALGHGTAVAALHAGWRGIASGILAKGVELLCEAAGCTPGDLAAAAGPAIGPCCYEVDEGTGARIAARSPAGVLADPHAPGRVRTDLWRAVLNQLRDAGVPPGRTEAVRLCTRCHPGLLHSYRRDGAASGRQIGFIATPAPSR